MLIWKKLTLPENRLAAITQSRKTNPPPLFYPFVIFAFSSFLDFHHFYTSAGQTCIAVVSKSKIDEEKLSSRIYDHHPYLSNHVGIGTLQYCHHHKPLLYSKNFAKLFSTQRHASSCGDVLGLCVTYASWVSITLHLFMCCSGGFGRANHLEATNRA